MKNYLHLHQIYELNHWSIRISPCIQTDVVTGERKGTEKGKITQPASDQVPEIVALTKALQLSQGKRVKNNWKKRYELY